MKYIFSFSVLALLLSSCSNDFTQKPVIQAPISESEYSVDPSDMLSPTLANGMTKSDISEKEKDSLLQMREEEKLAHDVYMSLYEKWGQQIFKNIASSEETHTNAVLSLLNKYAIPDPALSERGKFSSAEIQKLYDSLTSKGHNSLLDALIIGATIEDLDIYDLTTQMKDVDNADILTVYTQLKRGSENHMRAFVRNINKNGGTYTAQYISLEELSEIIANEQQRGMGKGRNN